MTNVNSIKTINKRLNSKNRKKRNLNILFNSTFRYIILTLGAIVMLYPILWLIGASFKNNNEIFTSIGIFPRTFDFSSYIKGWITQTQYTFSTYFINSFKMVIPKVILTVISSVITAYAFSRFDVPYKNFLFSALISTMFLPQIVTRIPLYLLFKKLNLLDTYVPLYANDIFANEAFFVFLLIQFFRTIPREIDEAAAIDGCNSFELLLRVLIPNLKPAIISVVLFQFLWSMDDFMGPLIYISSVEKYPVSLALRMAIDNTGSIIQWNQIIAMSLIALLPSIILFLSAQKYFVEGIVTTGLKG
ncbi:sugar ABC transporter permease [Thermoanaerobacterium thermosaccharolyticum]|uniref:carbohydrate ABC transporter permease n=1 Tax=Thermoanaerobacterium thermosaccharolyticum TaxID=1517 RepID=UPI000C06CABF|nr:carbohydrate ABC transporter permease [Thermoanaerobacterium thermosaccharolyticum]PHO08102.1 sugar ABC transporter permease [Thermoanaerobacterium thermosaccharolyticum]